jgi:hypothetical protein
MITYKILKFDNKESGILKNDKDTIPFDLANTDYQEYLKWLKEGNTPLPAEENN